MTDDRDEPSENEGADSAGTDRDPRPDGGPAAATGSAGPDPNVGKGLLDVDMGPSSALAHLYRGEVHRMKLWRERLDRTTNWAVILMAAILTYAFSNQANPHYVILIGNAAIGLFLVVEARRYRAYDVWRSRVRTIQENVWAAGLDEGAPTDANWRSDLADDYRNPALKITAEEAIAHRLRRVYLPMFAILNGAWLLRVTAFGQQPWPASAAIGDVSGLVVTALVVLVFTSGVVVACRPRDWQARGELRSEDIRDGQPRETRGD